MLLRNKLSLLIFSFNVYFEMAASMGSRFENKNRNIFTSKNPIFMQFVSKCAVFQILLDKIHLYFCVPFTYVIGEPKYNYWQQEQVIVTNGQYYKTGGLNRFYGIPTSRLVSIVLHYK